VAEKVNGMAKVKNSAIDALCDHVRAGKIFNVSTCLENDPDLVNVLDSEGRTPLFLACEYGHTDLVSILITLPNIDLNKQMPSDGRTALHIAIFKSRKKIARILLEHGAKKDILSKEGKTALQEEPGAVVQDQTKSVDSLLSMFAPPPEIPPVDMSKSTSTKKTTAVTPRSGREPVARNHLEEPSSPNRPVPRSPRGEIPPREMVASGGALPSPTSNPNPASITAPAPRPPGHVETKEEMIERIMAEREHARKLQLEKIAAEKEAAERLAAERAERQQQKFLQAELAAATKAAAKKAAADAARIAAEEAARAAAEKAAAERAAAEKLALEKAERKRQKALAAEQARIAAEKKAQEEARIAAEKAAAARRAAEEKAAAEREQQERIAAERSAKRQARKAAEERAAAEKAAAKQLADEIAAAERQAENSERHYREELDAAEKAATAVERARLEYERSVAHAANMKEGARLLSLKAAEDREKVNLLKAGAAARKQGPPVLVSPRGQAASSVPTISTPPTPTRDLHPNFSNLPQQPAPPSPHKLSGSDPEEETKEPVLVIESKAKSKKLDKKRTYNKNKKDTTNPEGGFEWM